MEGLMKIHVCRLGEGKEADGGRAGEREGGKEGRK